MEHPLDEFDAACIEALHSVYKRWRGTLIIVSAISLIVGFGLACLYRYLYLYCIGAIK